jgi:hypothetical protein
MSYVNTNTFVEYSESEIRATHPNTSYPAPFVAPEGYEIVFAAPQPEHNTLTQRASPVAPVLTGKGTWEQRWEVIELYETQAERDEAIAADVEAKRVAAVPLTVTMRQARRALVLRGYYATVDAAIAGMEGEAGVMARIDWATSSTVERYTPLTQQMKALLGLTDLETDELYMLATTL